MDAALQPYEGQEPYIFISYARKDAERATPFLSALSGAGYRIWYDAGIQAGADWLDALLEKVEQCAVFCPLFSEAFKDSYYCAEETKWAYRKRKTIVPLHLEEMARDGVPRLYELLQGRQDLRLYEFENPAQFVERLARESAFEPCKVPEWHKIGEIQWRLSADGVLEIARNEDMPKTFFIASIPAYQYDIVHRGSTAPWMPYRKKIFSVKISDNIDAIGDSAFEDCENLTKAFIGESVSAISSYAFGGCHSLSDMRIPDGVSKIGGYAFANCYRLTRIHIPESVTEISEGTFLGCFSLTNARIPDGVTVIRAWALADCKSLMCVRIPESVSAIGAYAFYGCENLKSVEIPAGAEVSEDAFPEHTRVIRRGAER